MKLLKNNKAFTIIELIVVIAVLGVLMLLAVPKFLGYTSEAKMSQIKNDIKAYEVAIEAGLIENEDFISNWNTVTQQEIDTMNPSEKVINKRGEIVKNLSGTNYFVDKNDVQVKSKLKGDFIWKSNGEVLYYDKNLGDISQGGNNSGDNQGTTYPIIHPNGDKEDKDGTITKPDGTVINPDGTINHPDGSVTHPNGDIHYPNGDILKPNGDILKPNGDILKPNGDIHKPNGDIHKPDGSVIHKDGTTSTALDDGSLLKSNGDVVRPDGKVAYLAKDSDFTWVEYDTSIGYSVPGKSVRGYYKYTGTNKNVVIPEKINGFKLTNYSHLFEGSNVTMVVNLNKDVTSMDYMFIDTTETSVLDLSLFNTSSVNSMDMMFGGTKAKKLDVSGFDTSNVTTMKSMFYYSEADNLDLSNFNTEKVEDMRSMFSNSEAKTLKLDSFNTSNVKRMDSMFGHSKALEFNLKNFNTEKVENMSHMFEWISVDKLDLTSFNTLNVKYMSDMFDGATIGELDLSSFDIQSSSTVYSMFTHAKITKGYAKDETNANLLNQSISSGSLHSIEFIVK